MHALDKARLDHQPVLAIVGGRTAGRVKQEGEDMKTDLPKDGAKAAHHGA
jgi:hypothetical protein